MIVIPNNARTGPVVMDRAVPWTRVGSYVITYPGGDRAPRIQLAADSGELVGQLVFAPEDEMVRYAGDKNVRYQHGDFSNVLELLRSEGPIYFVYNGSGRDAANGLQTSGRVSAGTLAGMG